MCTPTWKKVWCDANNITKFINQGMDSQGFSFFNSTVMHYWDGDHDLCNISVNDGISHQEDKLRIVKFLIEKGADMLAVDYQGFTPLLVAANGHYLVDLPNFKILDFLLEREEYSRAEKIEALQLAGATILKNTKHASLFHKGFDYWREALHLRHLKLSDSGCIEKPRLMNFKYVQTTEWRTSAELEDVIEHPDKFLIQSFLVRLRIFSSKNWGNTSYLLLTALDDSFRQLEVQSKFSDTFEIIWAMLETQLSRPDLRENKDTQWKTASVVEKLVKIFKFLDSQSPNCWTEDSSQRRYIS